jgi:RND family efflux transporter MFP subunit
MTCRRPAALLVLLPALIAPSCGRGRAAEDRDGNKAVRARIVPVEQRQVRRDVQSVGSLFPLEEVTVSSEVEGKVDRVLVDVGDRVARGQPLVSVSTVELELALEQQRAALDQVKARLGLAAEGGGEGEAAEVKRAAADLLDAEQKFNRARSLFDDGLIARGTFDESEARYKAAQAAHDMALQGVADLRAELARQRAALALAEKKLADAVIRAPFAGHVKERTVTPGQYLRVQTPVMVIVSTDPLRARLQVPEKVAGSVVVGGPVAVRVESLPERVFEGKVSRMSPSVDTRTRSLEVEALIGNREGLLKPGYFVKAVVGSEQVAEALFVPYDAVRYVFGVYKVFTVEGTQLKEREVKIGDRDGDAVEVLEGVGEAERVAVAAEGGELADGAAFEAVQ